VARYIVDNLRGSRSIGELGVVALAVIDLRMRRRCHDTDFDGLFVSGLAGGEASVSGVAVVSLDGVADIVGEYGDAFHLRHVLLESAAFDRQRRVPGRPAFAVDENRRIDFLEFFGHAVHGLGVVDGHEVEAEAVDMIFVGPVLD